MPKVSQEYLDARRAEILDAAIACFSRDGFHCATMQDIVRQSGLSPGAIYNYFKSKEEIIEAIAVNRHAKERRMVTKAMKEDSKVSALKQIRDEFFGELKQRKERLRRRVSIQAWAEAQRNPKILRIVRRSFQEPCKLLTNALAQAQRRGEISAEVDPEAMARFVIAAFHGLVLQAEWDESFSVEPQLKIIDMLLATISTPTKRILAAAKIAAR